MMDENQRDQQLFQAITKGDQKSFRKLFDLHYRQLLRSAISILKDENAAKDAVQDVFFQLWKNREQLVINSTVGGYLKRSVINRSLNQIKSRKPFVADTALSADSSKAPDPQQLLEAEDIQEAIAKGMDQLSEKCRTVFVLRRIEGYSVKEIAEKLEVSPKTVENQITKALKILKDYMRPFVKKNSS